MSTNIDGFVGLRTEKSAPHASSEGETGVFGGTADFDNRGCGFQHPSPGHTNALILSTNMCESANMRGNPIDIASDIDEHHFCEALTFFF